MKVPFLEIANRITGISTPIFGVQWTPPILDVEVARRLLAMLEDRRVLYNSLDLEDPSHCNISVMEIRAELTNNLSKVDRSSPLGESIIAMRAACRKYLDAVQPIRHSMIVYQRMHMVNQWKFVLALGELRGVFGIHIAQLSVRYGIDIEQELTSILPIAPM